MFLDPRLKSDAPDETPNAMTGEVPNQIRDATATWRPGDASAPSRYSDRLIISPDLDYFFEKTTAEKTGK
jgi:hypothetical protein